MKNQWHELGSYIENLYCLEKVMTRTVDRMKGFDYSFESDITDSAGEFHTGLLDSLIGDMLSDWKRMLRIRGVDPETGKDFTESYTRDREELCRTYLYITMRASMLDTKFRTNDDRPNESPDFACIMEHTRRLSKAWCVVGGPNGSLKNALLEGYGKYFGLHMYQKFATPDRDGNVLAAFANTAEDYLRTMTNDGNMKRMFITGLDMITINRHGSADSDIPDISYKDEYLSNCERFVTLFEQAGPDVIHSFCSDIDDIISAALVSIQVPVLLDTDKTLNIYSRIFDGPYRQSKKYAEQTLAKHD